MSADRPKIASLRDLPRAIEPPRDLWQGIEAKLPPVGRQPASAGRPAGKVAWLSRQRVSLLAAAAMVATLAVGVWIGRGTLPQAGKPAAPAYAAKLDFSAAQPQLVGFEMGPKYSRDRAELVKSIDAQIAALPPASRAKVIQSLRTIHDSMRDLQDALGRDPSNALLQELLVNTYQDEMRVLTAVHDAGASGKGI